VRTVKTAPETRPPIARAAWWEAALLVAVTVAIRLPAFFSAPSLVFDDGQYGVSIVDMRRGLLPYREVFSSQGPLHYPVLYLGDLLGLRTLNAPRVTPVLAGIAVTIGVFAMAKRLGAQRSIALTAALIVATTGTMLWTTGQVTGDGPAAGVVVLAVWAALVYRDEPTLRRALLTGVLFGAALAVKPLVIPAVIPIAGWLGSRRRARDIVAAAGAAAAVWLAAALPWGLSRVWDQSIAYHSGKGPAFSKPFQLGKLTSLLVERDGVLMGAVVLGLVALAVGVRHMDRARQFDTVLIGSWTAVVALELVFEKALFANHLATIVVPLALLLALHPPPLRWLAYALIVLVPWTLAFTYDMLRPRSFSGADAQLERDLRSLPRDAQAIADDPSYVWRAGLSTPAMMNDVSIMRLFQGTLSARSIAAAAATPKNCAVAIWTTRFNAFTPGLRDALRGVGYYRAREYAPGKELWLKSGCDLGRADRAPGAPAPDRSLG